jgi:hypothetical protein
MTVADREEIGRDLMLRFGFRYGRHHANSKDLEFLNNARGGGCNEDASDPARRAGDDPGGAARPARSDREARLAAVGVDTAAHPLQAPTIRDAEERVFQRWYETASIGAKVAYWRDLARDRRRNGEDSQTTKGKA